MLRCHDTRVTLRHCATTLVALWHVALLCYKQISFHIQLKKQMKYETEKINILSSYASEHKIRPAREKHAKSSHEL